MFYILQKSTNQLKCIAVECLICSHFCAFQQICALCIAFSAVHWLLPSTKSTHYIICSAAQFSASVCACAIHPQLHKLVHFKLYEDSVSAHLCSSLCNLFNVNFVLYRGFVHIVQCLVVKVFLSQDLDFPNHHCIGMRRKSLPMTRSMQN